MIFHFILLNVQCHMLSRKKAHEIEKNEGETKLKLFIFLFLKCVEDRFTG